MDKKKRERQTREKAEREAKARSESADRVESINVLEKELRKKSAHDGLRELGKTEPGETLVELLSLYREENEHLRKDHVEMEGMREFCPSELEAVKSKSGLVWAEQLIKTGAIKQPTPTSKQKSEWTRSMVPGVGFIEWEFGGAGEAEWRKYWLPGFGGPPYSPTCLDEIFRGGAVTMRRLQELFGMRRNRFPRNRPCFKNPRDRREMLYGDNAVRLIMESLLSERPLSPQKRGRGGSQRRLWLRDPDDPCLMTRVLEGIKARISSLHGVPEKIAQAFLGVVQKHLR
jgi:hypothetical protein